MSDRSIKIIVATHKKYRIAKSSCYLPVLVGSQGKQVKGYASDDQGENISEKNFRYCELTGLYWAWKNLDCDYLGLVHYRRYFSCKNFWFRITHTPWECVAAEKQYRKLLQNTDVILPKKRRYFIESLYSHYANTHYKSHLDLTREILQEKDPASVPCFDAVMMQTWGYMFNMFVMKRTLADEYCGWLFTILSELEKRVDASDYSDFQARYCGRVSELLFNVWLKRKGIHGTEIPYVHMEKIHWGRKIRDFLLARFAGRKFDKSF